MTFFHFIANYQWKAKEGKQLTDFELANRLGQLDQDSFSLKKAHLLNIGLQKKDGEKMELITEDVRKKEYTDCSYRGEQWQDWSARPKCR